MRLKKGTVAHDHSPFRRCHPPQREPAGSPSTTSAVNNGACGRIPRARPGQTWHGHTTAFVNYRSFVGLSHARRVVGGDRSPVTRLARRCVALTRVVIGDALSNSIPTPWYRSVLPGSLLLVAGVHAYHPYRSTGRIYSGWTVTVPTNLTALPPQPTVNNVPASPAHPQEQAGQNCTSCSCECAIPTDDPLHERLVVHAPSQHSDSHAIGV
jgi:hypothetical protein